MTDSRQAGGQAAAITRDRRIPVYLITGFLGSGKTTLLAKWLGEPLLADAVTVVNEYGEAGLDDRLLASATDLPNMVAGGCVCCTGLSGLAETLEELFWARLHREIKAFSCVAIETTGLAQPQPIVSSFAENTLLRERFVVKATIATVAATAGADILQSHGTARAQIEGADAVVITKTDLVSAAMLDALETAIHALKPDVPLLRSAHGELDMSRVLARVADAAGGGDAAEEIPAAAEAGSARSAVGGASGNDDHAEAGHAHDRGEDAIHEHAHRGHAHDHGQEHEDHQHAHDHDHDHLDGVTSLFVAVEHPLDDSEVIALAARLRSTYGAALLRAKGILALAHGGHAVLQLSPSESFYDLVPLNAEQAGAAPIKLGMTVILNQA